MKRYCIIARPISVVSGHDKLELMDERYLNVEWQPDLERPVLIAGFTGWNDAAEAASLSVSTMSGSWSAKKFAAFSSEEFFDYQATRPQIRLIDGITRKVEWPENIFSVAQDRSAGSEGRGVILLSGPEPNLRWRTFTRAVADFARELNVRLVVTVGALLADVPHSRPVSVAANSQDPSLTKSLGLSSSRYEGPTGITGVLHAACAERNLPSVSLWASVPHYLPAVPSAPATLAVLNALSDLLSITVDTAHLERTAQDYQQQVSAAVAQDSDLAAYVRMLEERFDSQTEQEIRKLPSGEELADELEKFLRDQRGDE